MSEFSWFRGSDSLLIFYSFLKLFVIVYATSVVPVFAPLPLPTHPLPSGNPHTIVMSMGPAYTFFDYSIPCAVLYVPMTIL